MRAATTLADELAIFTLSKLYRCHSVVYTKDKTWSMIGMSTPMNKKDVYQQCDLKFILMGKSHFVQLIKKPLLAMPVVSLQPMESIYEILSLRCGCGCCLHILPSKACIIPRSDSRTISVLYAK